MSRKSSLEEYKETYLDMRTTAIYFREQGNKLKHSGLINSAESALSLCKEGESVHDLLEAEAIYNEIAGEIYECNEIYDNLNE